MFRLILLSISLLCMVTGKASAAPLPHAEEDPVYDEYDGLALIRALVRDDKLEHASRLLNALKPNERIQSKGEVAYVRGLIALKKDEVSNARSQFQEALAAESSLSSQSSEVWGKLAETHFLSGDPGSCADAFAKMGDAALQNQSALLMKAECERKAKRSLEAWKTLKSGERKFGASFPLVREQLITLMKLGMRGEAKSRAVSWLSGQREASPWIGLAEVFATNGDETNAIELIELGRLRAAQDIEIHLTAVSGYHQRGWKSAMKDAFEKASLLKPEYSYPVAEILRQNGQLLTAYWWNLRSPKGAQRLRQKLAIAVEQGRWDLVASMATSVSREDLSSDGEVNYAMGYSLIRLGDQRGAERFLARIREPGLLGKVAALRKGQP